MRSKTRVIVAICICWLAGVAVGAQTPQGGKENAEQPDVGQDVDRLHAEILSLQKQLMAVKAQLQTSPVGSQQALTLKIVEIEGELKGKFAALRKLEQQGKEPAKGASELDVTSLREAIYKALKLEEAMAMALKHNPEILFAESKLREAEAELNRVQQQVLGKIPIAMADLKASRAISDETKNRLDNYNRLRAGRAGIISDLDIGEATVAVAKYKGEVERKEAELAALIGKLPPGNWTAKKLGEEPPVLRTYVVPRDRAVELAKVLQGIYQQSPTTRITNIGDTQIMVYGSPSVHGNVAELLRETGQMPAAERPPLPPLLQGQRLKDLIKAMETTDEVSFSKGKTINEELEYYSRHWTASNGFGVNIVMDPRAASQTLPIVELKKPITLAAMLQLMEDMARVRFIVRDYGIVGVPADDVPAGAVLLSDVVRGKLDKESKEPSK
jgi:hypothetical protein